MTDKDNSNATEKLLHGLVELLKVKGEAQAVNVLLHARAELNFDRYDNWNGGLYNVRLVLHLDYKTYGELSGELIQELQALIGALAEPLLDLTENDTFVGLSIKPREAMNEGWRDDAKAWVRGDGINNQGRVRSDNGGPLTCDGLLFRSQAEINVYKALKAKAVTFAPLPVFLRGGPSYHRLEPDFIVIKDGYVFQVEIDGDNFHRETPVDAQARTAPMEYEGVKVRRFRASEVDTEDKAKEGVDRLLKWIEKEKKNRA